MEARAGGQRSARAGAPRFVRALRMSPSGVPALVAVAAFVALGAAEGGFLPVSWYPAAVGLAALLAVSLVALPARARMPGPVVVAVVLLGAYAAWSYLSIAWADNQGEAWDGANRTAMYAVVFALFALWPMRAGARAGSGSSAVTLRS